VSKLPKKKYDQIRYWKKEGLSDMAIADKLAVSKSTVYRVTSGKKFRASLQRYRESLGIQQLNNGAVSAEVAAIALAAFLKNPEKILDMDARAIKDMGTFSNAQVEAGLKTLEKEIRAAEDAGDPGFQQAKELVLKKRQARIVNDIPNATDVKQEGA
jgi:predicted DNA-binding protein YlxM (UPF0122 family)